MFTIAGRAIPSGDDVSIFTRCVAAPSTTTSLSRTGFAVRSSAPLIPFRAEPDAIGSVRARRHYVRPAVSIEVGEGEAGAAGDLNGDGRPDLAIIDEALKANFILLNRGGLQFGYPVRPPGLGRPPYCVAIADLNRDRQPDIIVGYVEMPGSVYFNTGHGRTFHEIRWNDGKGTVYGMRIHALAGPTLVQVGKCPLPSFQST
ncbi:VCBS repeat-containing protein [Acidobacteria bacterium AB60]|nr:VCBS repeat-containing protein [Acidobacteria bacterium AB60]